MLVESEAKLNRILAGVRRELQSEFTLYAQELRNSFSASDIAQMLERGQIDRLLTQLSRANNRFIEAWLRNYSRAASEAVDSLRRRGADAAFDPVREGLVQDLRRQRTRLVREFSVRQNQALQTTLMQSMRDGVPPSVTAERLRDVLGLNARQARAIGAFEAGLAQAGSIPARQIRQMVAGYRSRLLAYQSTVLGQLESLRAVNGGTEEGWRQAIESGAILAEDVQRQWHAKLDGHTRDSHADMEEQVRGWNEPFLSGNGNLLRHPGDMDAPIEDSANCRCSLSFSLVTQGNREIF